MAAALATAYHLPPEDPEESPGGSMPFLAHLDELRKRILRSCIAIAAGTLVAFFFVDRIFRFVFAPAMRMLPPGSRLIYTQPGEAFSLYIDIALIAGSLLAAPFVMYQVWMFIAPYAILLIFIVAAVLTPSSDPWNQAAFAAPMIVLYLLSIVIAWAAAPRAAH